MNELICQNFDDIQIHNDSETTEKMNIDDQIECNNFAEKIYIPKRTFKKFFTPSYLIGASVVAVIILIIIIITVSVHKKSNIHPQNNETLNHGPPSLIIRMNNSLFSYIPQINKITLLQKTKNHIGAFDVHLENEIFLSEVNSSIITYIKSERRNDSKENLDIIFEEARVKPQAMAVDFITNKLYIIDKLAGTLIVINIQTKQYGICWSDLFQPHDILLDPTRGYMFILQFSHSIIRGNMDGTQFLEIAFGAISAIALDYKTERIYWINELVRIESSDYNGMNRLTIFTDHVSIISLAITDVHLFWLWPADGPSNSTIWTCEICNETCKSHRMESIDLHNASFVKAHSIKHKISFNNPCKVRNGGCQQLCLLASRTNAGRSCACYLGWQVSSNPRVCERIENSILYTKGNFIREQNVSNRTNFVDVILPTQFYTKSLTNKKIIDFEYDSLNGNFLLSDDVHIYKINLKHPENQVIIQTCTGSHVIQDLALDWLSRNLYYSKCSKTSNNEHSLMVFNIQRPNFQRTISSFIYDSAYGLAGCPYATVIDPNQGYLYFSAFYDSRRHLIKAPLSGTELTTFANIDSFESELRLLAIDYEENTLYQLHSRSPPEIKVTNLNDYTANLIKTYLEGIKTIYVHQEWMYLCTSTNIWRVNKYSGENAIKIIPRLDNFKEQTIISDVRIINSTMQSMYLKNPCAIDNGGCEQFCFPAPVKSCGCIDTQKNQNGTCL